MAYPSEPAPPAGEEIHLPGPSLLPVLMTVGIMAALLGFTFSSWLFIVGGLLFLGTLIRWIRSTRQEIEHLPASHDAGH
jgi:hypothetical protein